MQKNNDLENSQLMQALAATHEAKGVYKRHVLFKTVGTIILILMTFLLTAMMSLSIASEEGIFTVGIKELEPEVLLSLYQNKDLANPTSHLSFADHGVLDNIDGNDDIPNDVDEFDGEHCGENYLCYTFYLQNVGEGASDVSAQIKISNVVKGADEAVRIKLYEDGLPNVYAKIAQNGEPEPDTIAWIDESTAYSASYSLNPGEIKKYTIVVWLEGNDPECINNICGGFVRIDMSFEGTAKTDKN